MVAGGGIGLCSDTDFGHHFFFFFNSHPPLPSLSSPLFCHSFRITNEYALSSLNSPLLHLSASSSSSSSPSPSSSSSSSSSSVSFSLQPPMAAKASFPSSLDEKHEAARVERLWQQFFSDPSQWWDKRSHKENRQAPDFEHQTTEKALWIKDRFSPSWLHAKLATLRPQPPQHSLTSPPPSASSRRQKSCQALKKTQFWEEFFSDPSQWWDYRCSKKGQRCPDFKHKNGRKALWIDDGLNPPWVHARLAGIVQCREQEESGFSTPEISSRVAKIEQLWKEFFSDPSQWWHNRFIKKSPKYPDFQRKITHEGLWIEDWLNPPWVKGKIATIALGRSHSGGPQKSFYEPCRVPDSCNVDNVNKLCQQGRLKEVLQMVELMVQQNTRAPIDAYVGLLKGFAKRKALVEGKRVHALIVQSELDSDVFLGNALVGMYAKCGSVLDARKVFDAMPENNVFSWTAIISAYTDHGQGTEAINLFEQMQQSGIVPDKVAFVVALNACARIADLERGRQLHSQICRCGFESDLVIGNILVDMYAKCGCIEHARQVFDKMRERDVVSWNSMIAGYVKSGSLDDAFEAFNSMNERDVVSWSTMIVGCAQNGHGKVALALYGQMKHEGMEPNHVTYVGLLQACASTAALEQGKQLHSDIIKIGCESDVIVGSALVDMYANCGSIELARQVFNKMSERDAVSWTTMIAGYAQQGLGKEALTLLEQMQREGMKPTEATYVSVLSACSHSGLVDEGRHLFDSMCEDHGVTPTVEHYACMVDLMGRAGCLAEAEDFINRMPIQPDAVVWLTLLGAARNHGNVEIGRRAFDCVLKLEQDIDSAYVLLSNIYATAGMGDEVAKIRKEMKDVGVKKCQGTAELNLTTRCRM